MEAIKRIVRVPENHEIIIKVPQYLPENEIVEVILIVKKRPDSFEQKINMLKASIKDELFQNDIRKVTEDFQAVDFEGWDNGI